MSVTTESDLCLRRSTIRSIKAACREACGGKRIVEVGRRTWPGMEEKDDGLNFLRWGEDHDLDETVGIDQLAETMVRTDGGWVALDCYCSTDGEDGELDCNVYVLVKGRDVVYAEANDLGHAAEIDAILRAAGHPGYESR